jgi:predicted MPP superfamily phosphohydrolase
LKNKSKSKKNFLIILIPLLIAIWVFNNFTIRNVEKTLISDKINSDVKIAVISDLHSFSYGKDNKIILSRIREAEPDLIFVLGDMYSKGQTSKIDSTVNFISSLSEITEVCIVTGDHDYDKEYKEKLKTLQKVNLLNYEYKDLDINGNEIRVYGIDNVYFSSTFDLHNEFDEPDKRKLNILLSHIPSIRHYGNFGFDYIFSGDSHGGLIRIPLIGGIYFNGYILPEITYYDTVTDKGLYEFENTGLFVTSGLGHYPLPLRFNNRPEICFITIKGE